ncbi:transglycosylase domain-containing protein [Ornithinibacillus californiensis]|uniref:transglycosylase domain-containing protein n=1 Tax=Ornithinibacillus californiensis TaxID=161536 RepID=UPI00064DEE84|nr:transglycosylase domain-containing protein [Ornithinibacillus californiensis]
MDFKQFIQELGTKVKTVWSTGKIQRASRITYDVVWNVILFFIVIGIVGMFFGVGIGFGYFASLVKDEPIRPYESMEKDIYNYEETSKLYFAGDVYIGDIQSDLHREETKLEDISETLIDAVIATEDETFNEHNGIVPKAIIRALVQEFTNSEMKSGGSTLTQQLIKNQILTNEVSFERKAKEILLAMRLEQFFEKDQILEAYLNIIPYGRGANGRNIAGVQTAAQEIFGIDADEVNLPQAAFLAGLPQSPSYYTPYKSGGGLKNSEGLEPGINRMKTVLSRMYELEKINEEDYNAALEYDIVADFITESETPLEKYPYLTVELEKRAKEILMYYLAEKDGYTKEDLQADDELLGKYQILAKRDIRRNGYNIHSTIDKEIYDAFQVVAQNFQNYGPDWTGSITDPTTGEVIERQRVEASAVLIENSTGRIISFLGGRGFSLDNQLNFATDAKRSNGSTMKPILVYAPAMEKGIVQPGTPVADVETSWRTGDGKNYTPGNFDERFHGILPVREHLVHSYNVPAIKIYTQFNQDNPVDQYLRKMGITSLGDAEYANPALAIGGTSTGITIEENTNAFVTLANGGKFVDAYMIDKITNQEGEVIYEHKSESVDVFSPQTSYLTLDIMRDVVSRGSAAYLPGQLKYKNVDWAGKTGTSQFTHDVHFVGTNPNVTMGAWLGYRIGQSLVCNSCMHHTNRNIDLWAELINAASDIRPELVAPSESFQRPEGIVSRSICATSGMLPSDLCTEAGLVSSDIFNINFVPTQVDDSLIQGSYVLVDGKAVLAGPNTPKEFVQDDGISFNPEWIIRNEYDKLKDITQLYPSFRREAWEKISFPNIEGQQAIVEDDGAAPSTPTALNNNGNRLTWVASTSKDVIGYRVYRASEPGSAFELIGNSTGTEFSLPSNKGVYHVKAVDYFGLESSASPEIIIGDFSEPEEPEEPEEDPGDQEEPDTPEEPDPDEEDEDEDEPASGEDNDNGNGGGNGNGNGNGND